MNPCPLALDTSQARDQISAAAGESRATNRAGSGTACNKENAESPKKSQAGVGIERQERSYTHMPKAAKHSAAMPTAVTVCKPPNNIAPPTVATQSKIQYSRASPARFARPFERRLLADCAAVSRFAPKSVMREEVTLAKLGSKSAPTLAFSTNFD
jgi:hypothetical protein